MILKGFIKSPADSKGDTDLYVKLRKLLSKGIISEEFPYLTIAI